MLMGGFVYCPIAVDLLGLHTHRCVVELGRMEFDLASFGVTLRIINFEPLKVCVKGKNVHAARFRKLKQNRDIYFKSLGFFMSTPKHAFTVSILGKLESKHEPNTARDDPHLVTSIAKMRQ